MVKFYKIYVFFINHIFLLKIQKKYIDLFQFQLNKIYFKINK